MIRFLTCANCLARVPLDDLVGVTSAYCLFCGFLTPLFHPNLRLVKGASEVRPPRTHNDVTSAAADKVAAPFPG